MLIALVDMPELPLEVARRILDTSVTSSSLRQAVYNGTPGHPVLIGRDHWADLVAGLTGDRGARAYLVAHDAEEVECSDLHDGHDLDTPEQARVAGASVSTSSATSASVPVRNPPATQLG